MSLKFQKKNQFKLVKKLTVSKITRKSQMYWNIRNGHYQKSGVEGKKKKKRKSQMNEKASQNQTLQKESHQMDKHLGCPLKRYSGPFLKWKCKGLQQSDQKTRKLMTIRKHPKDSTDRLRVSRKEGGRGRVNFDDSLEASIQRLENHIKRTKNIKYRDQKKALTMKKSTERR